MFGIRNRMFGGDMARITNGLLLVAIGVVHELFGLLAGAGMVAPAAGAPRRNLLAEIARDGVINAIETDALRSVFFWYFWFGLALLMLGGLIHRLERTK